MLTAFDIMQTNVKTVRPELSLLELERAFLRAGVSGFPVVEGERLVGLVTRSDTIRQLATEQSWAEYASDFYSDETGFSTDDPEQTFSEVASRTGARLEQICVRDMMSRTLVTVPPETSLRELAALLVERRIHRLPVVLNGRLEGILTTFDVVQLVSEGRLAERSPEDPAT